MTINQNYNLRLSNKEQGLTLAEMMISMGLIGAVLIPMLFISSAVFLRQISDSRENVDVVQNASHVLNILTNDLQKVRRILPGSTTSEVHYASYDERTGKEALRGFRITLVSGSNYKLEHIDYNSGTDTWMAKSPYGPLAADDITLQKTGGGAPTFSYCLDTACSGATSANADPEKAVLLQLDDWVFTRGANTNSITLPDVNIHLASGTSAGGYLLSEGVRELYTIDTSIASSIGTGNPLTAISLTPGGGQFNYPDQEGGSGGWTVGGAGSGTLSTIITGASTSLLGYGTGITTKTLAFSPVDSRIFFGSRDTTGEFFTWKDNILSTIVTGQYMPGYQGTVVNSEGRVFFGEEDTTASSVWTWKDNILSTIATYNYGANSTFYVDSNDAVYFGQRNASGHLYRWKDGVLSTLTSGSGYQSSGRFSTTQAGDGRMFFGSGASTSSRVVTWKDNVLSTIGTNFLKAGRHSMRATNDGRIYFGSGHSAGGDTCVAANVSNAPYFTWKDNVLSTIVTSERGPGCSASAVAPDGRIYFGEVVGSGSFWTWKDNVLSTIVNSVSEPGTVDGLEVGSDGAVYFSIGTNVLRWKDNVLSTLMPSSGSSVARDNAMEISPLDDRLYWGANTPDMVWTWKDNVLSTIQTTGSGNPGNDSMIVNAFGRVFWGGTSPTTDRFFTWHTSTGLSTITPTNGNRYGSMFSANVSPFDGRVVFGTIAGDSLWTWHDGSSQGGGGNIIRLDSTGNKNNQNVAVAAQSTYDLSAQDIDGEFYFMNNTDGELHRYTWAGGTSSYTLSTSFTMGGFASDVVAMAIDQAEDTIAFLDKDGSQPTIQIYANRKASSTPALTTRSLGALGSSEPDNPTGMAINGRTGDFLIIDSDQKGANPNYYVNLLVVDPTVSRVKKTFKIYTKNTNTKIPISFDASGETNFKLHYDDAKNIIYLVSPSTEKIITMTLPEYLE